MERSRLKAWLRATNRDYMVFHSQDAVDALDDDELEVMQQLIALYTKHRNKFESGRHHVVNGVGIPIAKSDVLERDEALAAVDQLLSYVNALDVADLGESDAD